MATKEVFVSGKRYTDEFKIEAVRQVTDRGHPAAEVAKRLGITIHSLYACMPGGGSSASRRRCSGPNWTRTSKCGA